MRAVDTNIVVRYLVADDDDQFRRAVAVFAGGNILVATTVILETEWVLRGIYRFSPDAIAAALKSIAGLPGVHIEDAERLRTALNWLAAGMDFADALHLAGARACTAFVTFDRRLAKAVAGLSDVVVVVP